MYHYTDFVKEASALSEATDILGNIYDENPKHWPNGLTADHFDGGLYLIRKSASHEPVGFVGWQERREGMDKIGYYSIGIKPEHRRHGFAKEAISKLVSEKAASVDVVRALVESTNKPSINLASKLSGLGIETEVTKSASVKQARNPSGALNMIKRIIGSKGMSEVAGAGAGMGVAYGENKLLFEDSPKIQMINLALGGLAGGTVGRKLKTQKLLPANKRQGIFDLLNKTGLTWKQLGLFGANEASQLSGSQQDLADQVTDYASKATDRVDTLQQAAEANLEAEQTRLKGNMWKDVKEYAGENPWKTGLIGGGLGASVLGAYLYNAVKKPNKAKPGVMTVEIPEGEVRDRFYTNLSRNMLFNDKGKKKKKTLALPNK
jgi:ElaB/YqjD/DUF883 family membrane-anchored ribosome-binding protein